MAKEIWEQAIDQILKGYTSRIIDVGQVERPSTRMLCIYFMDNAHWGLKNARLPTVKEFLLNIVDWIFGNECYREKCSGILNFNHIIQLDG